MYVIDNFIFENPILINLSPATSFITDYGPIIAAFIGPFLSVLLIYFVNKNTKSKEIREKKSVIAKALIAELNYLFYSISQSYDTVRGFYTKTPNDYVKQEDIDHILSSNESTQLNAIISILKNDKTLSYDYAIMFKEINKDLFIFREDECQKIINFYYFLIQKSSMLKYTLDNYYSRPLSSQSEINNSKVLIESYLRDTKEIFDRNQKIREFLESYVVD